MTAHNRSKIWINCDLYMMIEFIYKGLQQHIVAQSSILHFSFQYFKGIFGLDLL